MPLYGFIVNINYWSDVVMSFMANDKENPFDIVKDRWKMLFNEELKDSDIEIYPLDYYNFVSWSRSFD